MQILFQKGLVVSDILICIREDGSRCAETLSVGSAYHDLSHFAVESAMGWDEGIWGMIAKGYSLSDYNLPNETRPFPLSKESYHAEFLASLVQSAVPTGKIDPGYVEMLRQSSAIAGLPFPALPDPELLAEIILLAQSLTIQWKNLPLGASMELAFLPKWKS